MFRGSSTMTIASHSLGSFASFLPQLLWIVAAVCFIYAFFIAIYRLTLHPLAKYPGPTLGRLTDWYSVYYAWGKERHLDFYKLHQNYGSVVRYGPNSLSFNTSTAMQSIYGYKSNVQKSRFYSAFPAQKGAWSTHSAIEKSLHARKRRVLSQAFGDNAMRGLQPHILGVIRTFTAAINDFGATKTLEEQHSKWSSPKDMSLWANYMSYDVLGDICYGQSFDTLVRPDNRFAIKLVGESSRFHYLNAQMPGLKRLGLDRLFFKDLRANRQRFMAYSRARLSERMKLGTDTDRRDFFYYLLKAKDPETGEGFLTQELWGESNVLLIAGSDTTSTAFSASFFYLLHHPRHLLHLTRLVRSTFESVEDIVSGPELSNFKYLRACIDESMRLSPPVPTLLPREILTGGMQIDGIYYPAGTVVGVPTYALHHNPCYFPEPFAYKPERWLQEDNASPARLEEIRKAQSAFCPFSVGPRGCIGKGVAYMELTIALARVLWLYDLKLAQGKDHGIDKNMNYGVRDIFVAEKEGPIVEFKSRHR